MPKIVFEDGKRVDFNPNRSPATGQFTHGSGSTGSGNVPVKSGGSGSSLAAQANANQQKSLSGGERHAMQQAATRTVAQANTKLRTGKNITIQETTQVLAAQGIELSHGKTAPDASGRWTTTYKLTHKNGKVEEVEAGDLRRRLQGKAPKKTSSAPAKPAMSEERRQELLAEVRAIGQMPGAKP